MPSWVPRHVVLIDGDCGRCRRTARVLAVLDRARRLRVAPLQDPDIRAQFPSLPDQTALLDAMHVICGRDGRIVTGYRACVHIGMSLPLCWPLLPLAGLLLATGLGESLYRLTARTRHRTHEGACAAPRRS